MLQEVGPVRMRPIAGISVHAASRVRPPSYLRTRAAFRSFSSPKLNQLIIIKCINYMYSNVNTPYARHLERPAPTAFHPPPLPSRLGALRAAGCMLRSYPSHTRVLLYRVVITKVILSRDGNITRPRPGNTSFKRYSGSTTRRDVHSRRTSEIGSQLLPRLYT